MKSGKRYRLGLAKKRIQHYVSSVLEQSKIGVKVRDGIRLYCEHNNYRQPTRNYDDWLLEEYDREGSPLSTFKVVKKRKKKIATIKKEYKSFLKTKYWKIVRDMVLRRDNNTCTRCGYKANLQVHHLTYKNHKNELNHLEDLITLCGNCHKEEHGIEQ